MNLLEQISLANVVTVPKYLLGVLHSQCMNGEVGQGIWGIWAPWTCRPTPFIDGAFLSVRRPQIINQAPLAG
jgi:hypothetical protein